jgi:hypothetical protein
MTLMLGPIKWHVLGCDWTAVEERMHQRDAIKLVLGGSWGFMYLAADEAAVCKKEFMLDMEKGMLTFPAQKCG